jgi:hypothetical protein
MLCERCTGLHVSCRCLQQPLECEALSERSEHYCPDVIVGEVTCHGDNYELRSAHLLLNGDAHTAAGTSSAT